MKLSRSFPKGGIQPHDDTYLTREAPIWNSAIPPICVVPLVQHAGPHCERLVEPGSRVTEGMMIGRAGGDGAHVHAPVPGIVRRIVRVTVPECGECEAVEIELNGAFSQLGKELEARDWRSIPRKDLVAQLRELGIVELSGSPHPIHRSLQFARRAGVSRVVLNGAESGPYLSSEDRLMQEKPSEVLTGLEIIAHLLHCEEAVCAVGADKRTAERALRSELRRRELNYRVFRVGTKYPQGAVPQLLRSVQRKEIPYGKDERALSCFVLSVATAFAVAHAVLYGKPCLERVVTVAGGGISRPGNVKVRIGTSFAELIAECGGVKGSDVRIISGDPLTGHEVQDLKTPVTKTTRAVLVLSPEELGSGDRLPCIGCGRCVRSCPIGLEPQRLFKLIDHEQHDRAVSEGLNACTECGACSYVCPSRLPLTQVLAQAKSERLLDYGDTTNEYHDMGTAGYSG